MRKKKQHGCLCYLIYRTVGRCCLINVPVLSQPGNLPHFPLIITFNYRNVTPTTSNSWCHIALVWRALLSEIHWSISGVWLPESNEDRADLSSWDYKPANLVVPVYIPIVAGWWNYIATFIEEANRWDMWHCFVFLKKILFRMMRRFSGCNKERVVSAGGPFRTAPVQLC